MAAIAGQQLADRRDGNAAASPTPTAATFATPVAVTSGTPAPSASALPSGTHENRILGYRITLPEGYRRAFSRLGSGQDDLGVDLYTRVSERVEREACQRDSGDVGSRSPERDSDIRIGASRNPRGLSAADWATTPRSPGSQPLSTHQKVESATIGGREAVRLVQDQAGGETTAYVIRADDRMYEVGSIQMSLPSRLPKGWLDDIAATFRAIAPQPFPTPTATAAPQVAARDLGEALGKAFAARDADAVARLMSDCWLFVWPLIDGQPPGGVLYRSVALFTQGLRERFAAGDLTVTVDHRVQTEGSGPRYFVRSDWREPDRTTRIDLFLSEVDGKWLWREAVHH